MTDDHNLFDPSVRKNPYPFYAALREEAPAVQVEPLGAWLVSRYDEVVEVLRNPRIYSSAAMRAAVMQSQVPGPDGEESDGPPPMLITTDPPKHDRLRALINRGFTPRRIADLEPRIRQICDEILAGLAGQDEIEFVSDVAVPFPVRVIAEMLGVESDRIDDFKRWSQAVVAIFGRLPSEEERLRADAELDQMSDYFEAKVEERRADPGDDLISVLVSKEEEDALTLDEVIGFAILLLIAGNETTTNLLGNTLVTLQELPETLGRAQRDPAVIPALVEEALRYASPVQLLFRQTTQDTVLGGVQIPQGAIVLPSYAAANRDPRRFPEPDRFDIDRDTQGHVAFGLGIHFCLGAGLARLEAKVALESLIPALPMWKRVDDEIEWTTSPFLRGPACLPLTRTLGTVAEGLR